MSTTLFFLAPIAMLAVVWSVCFVGCVPPDKVYVPIAYSNTILTEPSLIAYWPLSDFLNSQLPAGAPALPPPPQGSTGLGVALDISGNKHNGTYLNPPLYPSGTTFLTTMGNPPVDLNPTLNLHQASIVPGDGFMAGSKNAPACVDFEGGYVSIPWAANSPSLADFTLEAWVNLGWTAPGFNWLLFSGRTNNNTGFDVYINTQNEWQFNIGTGMTILAVSTGVAAPINLKLPNPTTYVAVTFKSTGPNTGTLSLWINPDSDDTSAPPTPLFTSQTTYAAIDRTQAATFFIGAGDNQDAPRTTAGGAGAPKFPYKGLIQSVALYSTALQSTDLASHFAGGAASDS